ncbi:hypothetical protein NA57DRAFT_39247 [Rhizodiscina lignyota]|uniref:ER-bound oxygenase mpaB/mpaB'/Rubber oxygenase catalytic domain-containing protein n=1 Tax=Rhizodiscina lignyota TaxID=1504668 RepID=A0A9P4M6N5_9PEZI|nr:hypothetical protein NA57DRAFT_39247 [Rhizodiscina lignyota]
MLDRILPILSTDYSWTAAAVALLVGYVTICKVLRYQRARSNPYLQLYKTREDYSRMTAQHAYEIFGLTYALEFPWLLDLATKISTYRTIAMPSVAKLLVSTGQFNEPKHAPKRYADTALLIGEFVAQPPGSSRSVAALARTNYLHEIYQKAGKISNKDMIYVLGAFVLIPIRFVNRWGYRKLSPLETCAFATHWKRIGDGMHITWEPFPSNASGFKDGLQWLEELDAWCAQYESENWVADENSYKVGQMGTTKMFSRVPQSFRPILDRVISALMDDWLRTVMMFPKPSPIYGLAISSFFAIQGFVIRNFLPPRPFSRAVKSSSLMYDPKTERYNYKGYDIEPWYVKPTTSNRYGLDAWYNWILGNEIPGSSDKFVPGGIRIEDTGPYKYIGKGKKEFEREKEHLFAMNLGGCPFGH